MEISGAIIEHTSAHVHVAFDAPRRVLSSAVLNGGLITANRLLNLRVSKDSCTAEMPEDTLFNYCSDITGDADIEG